MVQNTEIKVGNNHNNKIISLGVKLLELKKDELSLLSRREGNLFSVKIFKSYNCFIGS